LGDIPIRDFRTISELWLVTIKAKILRGRPDEGFFSNNLYATNRVNGKN